MGSATNTKIASAPSMASRIEAWKFGKSFGVRFQHRTTWRSSIRFFVHALPMILKPNIEMFITVRFGGY
jgi:hypothetical protein